MKFSSFSENEKEYNLDVDNTERVEIFKKEFESFVPKKEVTHEGFPFDEHTRMRLHRMPIHTQYDAILGRAPEPEAQS